MSFILKGCKIYGQAVPADLSFSGGASSGACDTVFQFNNCVAFPGFVDVHVHLREPGFSYKETIGSGTLAAARGGYTCVCSMPNLNPVPDCAESLNIQLELIKKSAVVEVLPYGALTVGERGEQLSAMESMAPFAVAFSDDGRGVQSEEMMRNAMKKARSLNKIIAAHCEDNSLLFGGYIHAGGYAKAHGHRGICSESEWKPIERDLKLAAETGCSYHVCHISTKESVALIRKAKAAGVDVTCETAPHYLLLSDADLQEDGRFKMNPPLRDRSDREALIEGLCDGTIDMIATDHAPHSAEEKGKGLQGSAMGIVGLETAFPLLYTYLVKEKIISLDRLVELMHTNPCRRFGIKGGFANECFTVFDLNSEYAVNPEDFASMGRATPFEGVRVNGECLMTVCEGRIAWRKGDTA